jgi:hypothetical protein
LNLKISKFIKVRIRQMSKTHLYPKLEKPYPDIRHPEFWSSHCRGLKYFFACVITRSALRENTPMPSKRYSLRFTSDEAISLFLLCYKRRAGRLLRRLNYTYLYRQFLHPKLRLAMTRLWYWLCHRTLGSSWHQYYFQLNMVR